jgi:predicted MFS family arabinose efflux permease
VLKEQFLGRNPSHFIPNPIVKAYILSESLMWSAWNLVTPLFAVFVVSNIQGGNLQIAASSFSAYLLSRVFSELFSGKVLLGGDDHKKLTVAVVGTICISLAYVGFASFTTVWPIFAAYCLAGFGIGFSAPAKNALFSLHLDKNKAATEWGIADATQFACMAAATALGGFIATAYGFSVLFLVASVLNIISIIPYWLCFKLTRR